MKKVSYLKATRTLRILCLITGLCLFAAPLSAKDKLPESTKDGLQLQHHTKLGAVYLKPGATLSVYDKVKLLDVYVAFEKNWQRDHNREEIGLEGRVSDKDMQKMKTELATGFNAVFKKELEKGGYSVVDEIGADVMILRPAIINLTVTSPDILTAGISATFVASNGSMTLYAELYDSVTSDKFAEVLDAEEVGDHGFARQANRVTNKVEFDNTLKAWASILRKRLDEANEVN